MHSLFIGLGGAGTYAVAELKRKMLEYGYNVSQDNFLFIDTEKSILEKYDFIKDDFVPLSGDSNTSYSVQSVKAEADDWSKMSYSNSLSLAGKHFNSWFDEHSSSLVSNRNLNAGAEGARMFTRVMLWKNYTDIKQRINLAMSYQDQEKADQRIERIYLVSGTCGGTGSGSVLDIMYMLAEMQNENQEHDVDLNLSTILIMPHGYIKDLKSADVRKGKYHTNAYAMLDEINAITKDYYLRSEGNNGKCFFKYRCRADINQVPFEFSVCNSLFMIDSYDNKRKQGTLDYAQVSDNVSNFLFALESGSAAEQVVAGNFCNITKSQTQSTVSVPYIKGFCANGMYVVQTWEELIRKYVKEKFIYQLFQYGFVGSDEFRLDNESIAEANNTLSEKLRVIKNRFYNNSTADRNQVWVDKKDVLKTIAAAMIEALTTKDNKVDDIFQKSPKKEFGIKIKESMDGCLSEVKDAVYEVCMDMVKRYSLRHAIALIKQLDESYDKLYRGDLGQPGKIKTIKDICENVLGRDSHRLEHCKTAFDHYIDYLIIRNLCNDNDGYLDTTRKCLIDAVDNIQVEGRKLPGSDIMIKDWEKRYKNYLNTLKADNTRKLIPELPNNLLDQQNNELERKYAELVLQISDEDLPDLTYDVNNKNLLYSFKKKIIDDLLNDNKSWTRDKFSFENKAFAEHCSTILDEFMKKAIKEAERLSQSSSLSIPFMDKYADLDSQKKKDVENALRDYADIALSLTKPAEGYENLTGQIVYLSDNLDENEGLGQRLKEITAKKYTGGQMGVSISNSVVSDRIIKLFVKSGFGFDDYSFFKEYERAFFTYYGNPTADHHQCYIHKDFLKARTEEKITLNEKFNADAILDYKEALKDLWRDKEGTVFKFAVIYLTRLLSTNEILSTNLMKPFDPIADFIHEEKDDAAKKWEITMGTTNDFRSPIKRPRYIRNASTSFNLLNGFSRADIEPFKVYLEFWSDILKQQLLDNKDLLTTTKMNAVLAEASTDLIDKLTIEEGGNLAALITRYSEYITDGTGHPQLDSSGHLILKQWKWADFFKDCLLGLFDR